MQPYGLTKKIIHNFEDYHLHPKRLYVNWWEAEAKSISKKRERRKAKKEIEKDINNE